MHDLDELLWSSNGDGSNLLNSDWLRIAEHLFVRLQDFFQMPLHRSDGLVSGSGVFVLFESLSPTRDPLAMRIRGTFGVDFPGAEYPCVQGFVYVYSGNLRVVTLTGENHIYLRYARTDASANDWNMEKFTGTSEWQSYGWSLDEYGEFEEFERWDKSF